MPLTDASKRLGHSNPHVTATVYAHAMPGHDDLAAKAWEKFQRDAKPAKPQEFAKADTTPVIAKSGEEDKQWETVRNRKPSIWKDAKLEKAGTEFSALIKAQREAFKGTKGNADFQEKGMMRYCLRGRTQLAF